MSERRPPTDMRASPRKMDADAEILSLFRQWIAACHDYDREEREGGERDDGVSAALDRRDRIEDEIVGVAAGGAAALAIKAFLILRGEYFENWSPELATTRAPELFTGEKPGCWRFEMAVSFVRDAAKIVPEIAELAAPIVHEDAALLDAEIGILWCHKLLADDPVSARLETRSILAAFLARIADTEAKTPRGRAIRRRHLRGAARGLGRRLHTGSRPMFRVIRGGAA
jgi:hypothetical protein